MGRPGVGFGDATAGTRRIAVYLRRSTNDGHQPFSISAQEAALHSYIASQPGCTLVAKYADDASGATTRRPDLQRLLTAAQAGLFDAVLVVRVDRCSRRRADLLGLLAHLDDCGVAFISATEPFDTFTSIGRMLVQLLGLFAEFERETIIDRVTNGMTAKAAKGKWPGGSRPYEYYVDKDTSRLIPYPGKAPHVKEIYRQEGLIPVFPIPASDAPLPEDAAGGRETSAAPVRAMVRSVGRWAERTSIRTAKS